MTTVPCQQANGAPSGAGHTVTVEPPGIILEVHAGETVMDAAERLGWRWPTICHGDCDCTACWCEITEGADNASAMGDEERTTLETFPIYAAATGRTIRLACRVRVSGPVVLRKKGVVPA